MTTPELGFDLLLEDGPALVINKPGGILTQSPPGIDSVERRIKAFLKHRDGKTGNVYLGVPHRLDRPASGAMVFARHSRAARRLAEQFEGRLVQKIYLAIVAGETPEAGTWTDHLRKIPGVARGEVVPPDHEDGREAVLHFQRIALLDSPFASVLQIKLETGRMHQVRIQASSRGHPLWGDEQYGSEVTFGPQTEDPRMRWIALHAHRLEFRHPMTRLPVAVVAPLPEPWSDVSDVIEQTIG